MAATRSAATALSPELYTQILEPGGGWLSMVGVVAFASRGTW